MRELAFGDQEVVFKPGDNKENYAVKRMPEIEQWATDIYNFVAGKYGEENIVAFYVHLDETSPHIHCVLLPIKDGKFAFKEIFAGANNREYSQRTSKLHDELAMVNEPWELVRGTSQTETRQRHRPTEEYRKHLSEECSSKEEELDNLNKAVSDLRVEIALAERRVKGLSSMVEHLEEERHQKMLEIDKLKVLIANKEGDSSILSQKLEKLQNELASVDEKLADKKDKLAVADQQLDELNKDMEFVRRFSLHILPKRFVKIRHYGFLSSTWKRQKLRILQEKLLVTVLEKVEKKPFLPKCPCCKTGNLHRIAVFDQRGPPAWYLGSGQNTNPYKN
jgi:predicted nuclease with TOPRIM domain